jgi:phage terminase Nu1 subunit (DNA packaging protein)
MSSQTFITKADVAAALNVDVRTVTKWQADPADPLPIAVRGKRGKPHRYDIAAVFAWGFRRRLAELQISDDGEVYDFEAERARLTHEQADKVGLEVAQLRGELLPTRAVLQTWQLAVTNMRAKILALPTKAAHAVQAAEDLGEIRDVLTTVCYEALEELATDGIPDDVRELIGDIAVDTLQRRPAEAGP